METPPYDKLPQIASRYTTSLHASLHTPQQTKRPQVDGAQEKLTPLEIDTTTRTAGINNAPPLIKRKHTKKKALEDLDAIIAKTSFGVLLDTFADETCKIRSIVALKRTDADSIIELSLLLHDLIPSDLHAHTSDEALPTLIEHFTHIPKNYRFKIINQAKSCVFDGMRIHKSEYVDILNAYFYALFRKMEEITLSIREDIMSPLAEGLRDHIDEIAYDTLSSRIHSTRKYFTHNIISIHKETGTTLSDGCYAPLLQQHLLQEEPIIDTPRSPY